MILQVFFSILLLFGMAAPGYWLARRQHVQPSFDKDIANLLMKVVYPCLIFRTVYQRYTLEELADVWYLPLAAVVIMLTGLGIGSLVSPWLKFRDAAEKRAFHYQSMMNNFSFLPLALLPSLVGMDKAGDATAILLLAAFGADAVVWSAGVMVASEHKVDWFRSLLHLFSPPLFAMYLGISCRLLTDSIDATGMFIVVGEGLKSAPGYGGKFLDALELVGKGTIPLAMIQSGSRLAKIGADDLRNLNVWLVTGLRLLVIPAVLLVALLLLRRFLHFTHLELVVLATMATMPVATIAFTFSELFHMDKRFVSSSYLVSTLLAIVTVPLLLGWFLSRLQGAATP